MAVSTTSILNKLLDEAKQANETKENTNNMQKHVANMKLLCELLLDEEETGDRTADPSISSEEMKAMMGKDRRSKGLSSQDRKTTIGHDEANGDSLFDF